jgi:hypothetical protein
MKKILKLGLIATAAIIHVSCSAMMTVYDKGATFNRHDELLPELRDKMYDNLDLKTQDSYLCTNKKNNSEGTERWKHNFVSAYKLQDPSFTAGITIKPLLFVTTDFQGYGVIKIINPASSNFYGFDEWEDYRNGTNNPAPYRDYSPPAGFALNIQPRIHDTHFRRDHRFSRMVLHAAMGDIDNLKNCINSDTREDHIRQVADIAIHQKQLPALSLALKAKSDILEKLSNRERVAYLKDEVRCFERNILSTFKNKDLDAFKILIQSAPYDIMIQGIPEKQTYCDPNKTLRNVIINAEAQGLCTQKEIDLFDAIKKEKFNMIYPDRRVDFFEESVARKEQDDKYHFSVNFMDCTIS